MQIVFSDVTIPRRPERIKVHLATHDGFERPPEARVGGGKKRIDTVETAEKRACIRGFAHRKELTYFAAVDRMAARDSRSADGKTRQLPPRHQFERRIRIIECAGADEEGVARGAVVAAPDIDAACAAEEDFVRVAAAALQLK